MAVSFGKNVNTITQNTKTIFDLFNKADFKKPMCLDIETTGLNRFKDTITTIQLGYFEQGKSKIERFFLEVSKFTDDEIKIFLRGLLNARLITHNGKFDILFLERYYGIKLSVWQDTLLMAHICGEEELGLKYLVKKYFKVDYDIDTELKKGKVTQELIDYALDDVYYPFKLFKIFKKKIIDEKLKNIYKHELRVYKAYMEVERTGIPISPRRHQIAKEVKEKYTVILDRLLKVANINWNSTDQLAMVMFTELNKPIYGEGEKLPNTYDVLVDKKVVKKGFTSRKEAVSYAENLSKPSVVKLVHNYEKKVVGKGLGLEVKEYTSTGKPSVGVSVLSEYRGNPVIDDLLEYKKLVKLETFIISWEKLQFNDRIYPSFNITARTGRTTCNNPNLQQVPQDSRIRNLIEAREGYVVIECDYSQCELRVMAWLSGDENMQKAYNSGSDLHESTMNLIYGDNISQDHDEHKRQRTISKSSNFGMVYGGQPQTLVNYTKSWGIDLPLEEAKKLHKLFFEAYPKLIEFYDYCKDYTRCYGYIRSPLGRKRWLPEIYSTDWKKKSGAERQCINSPVQGMASDICVSALADIVFSEELDHTKFTVLGSVHDAILIECKEEYAEYLGQEVAKIMSKPSIIKNLDVPIPFKGDVEIHKSWGG